MCNIDHTLAASGTRTSAAVSGAGAIREQLVIFLADTLRGTAEERAPLVLTMSWPEAATPKAVTAQQVTEVSRSHLKDTMCVPVLVQLLVHHLLYSVSFLC